MAAVMFGQYIAHDVSSKQSVQYVDGGNGEIWFQNERKIKQKHFRGDSLLRKLQQNSASNLADALSLSANHNLSKRPVLLAAKY